MTTLYPWGYQTVLVTLDRLKELARIDLMEQEYAERLFAWIKSRGGHIGIGGAVRFSQPDKPGFAPAGKSFHEMQRMSDGQTRFMAVDLVARNGSNIHRAPRWDEVPGQGSGHSDIRDYGVHCNVGGEPWHMQAIEVDGYDSWVNGGRRRPNSNFVIKGSTPTPAPKPKPPKGQDPGTIAPGTRSLRVTDPRMYGIDIAFVQQTLTKQGLALDDDGYYGPDTAEAVKVMQGWNNLTRSGVIGPKTWEAIIAYSKPKATENKTKHLVGSRVLRLTSPTMRGSDVLWVQNVIKEQGLSTSVDSIYGKQTVNRVKIVQGWNNLKQDGICGPETFEALKRY